MKKCSWQKLLIAVALAAGCVLVGATLPTTNRALGEGRGVPQQPPFVDTSVPILQEISTTLHQMDGRLARLEVVAQKMQAKAAMSAPRATRIVQPEEGAN
jgi:hypothetical protein